MEQRARTESWMDETEIMFQLMKIYLFSSALRDIIKQMEIKNEEE